MRAVSVFDPTPDDSRMFSARYENWLENKQKMAILEDFGERVSYHDPDKHFEVTDLIWETADNWYSVYNSDQVKEWVEAGHPDPEDLGVVPHPENEDIGLTTLDRIRAALYGLADAYLEQIIWSDRDRVDTSDYLSVLEVINDELAKYGLPGYEKDGKRNG